MTDYSKKKYGMGLHLQAIAAKPKSVQLHPWGKGAFAGGLTAAELYSLAKNDGLTPKHIAAKAEMMANILDGHAQASSDKARVVAEIARKDAHRKGEYKEDRMRMRA